jgi:hypothetical protein
MESTSKSEGRIEEITSLIGTQRDLESLQLHLREILDGPAFKGSHRSGQFLTHIVNEALAGHPESLKERVLGAVVFGRSPSYDTGEDAIVRVTASDVRKRLLQHYGRAGAQSDYRISLPSGSYVPRITRERRNGVLDVTAQTAGPTVHANHISYRHQATPVEAPALPGQDPARPRERKSRRILLTLLTIPLLILAILIFGFVLRGKVHRANNRLAFAFPWSILFNSQHSLQLITSDPNIAEIQGFTGGQISLSDYANHNYIPHPELLTAEENHFCRVILRGDKASIVDTPIAVSIAQLAQTRSKQLSVRAARNVQLFDLHNDDNFILLGSPRSNPWANILNDYLDFRFEFDQALRKEIIRNVRPHPGEQATYIATAPGWATGQSFAIVALLQNPDQHGQALLLAGENGEGTEAAGKLIIDQARLDEALRKCERSASSPPYHFEILLRLNTLAGSSNHVEPVACHSL